MGLKNVLSSSLGQVDFLAGQVTFKAHLLKGPGKSSSNKIIIQDEQEMVLGKRNVKAAC